MKRKGTVLLALLLIALGGYLLLAELGLAVPGWHRVWPIFPLAAGLFLLFGYLFEGRRDPERVFFATALTLVGAFFLTITLGPLTYAGLSAWWPVFVLIGGVAFLAQWAAAGFRDWDALFLALVALSVGGARLAITRQLLGPQTGELLPRLWPLALILAGLMALLRGLLGGRSP